MNKKFIAGGIILLGILVLSFLAYIYKWDTPITGFIVKNQDSKNGLLSRFTENDVVVETYLTNLGVDKIKLPDGSKDADAIFLLSSINMRNNGKNMKDYKILDTIRTENDELTYRFKGYYDESEKIWIIKYYADTGFLKVSACTVEIDFNGELSNFNCKDSSPV